MRLRMRLPGSRKHPPGAKKSGYQEGIQTTEKRIRWVVAVLIIALAVSMLTSVWPKGSPGGTELLTSAEAASGMEVNIPWNQTLNLIDAESTGVTKTFSYRLVPAQSNAPAPVEATDGVYTFKATGTQSGQMKLHFNFPSAGYYT